MVPVSGGTTDDRMMPVILALVEAALAEQLRDENAELVGRALAQRLQPPALGQPRAVEHPEHDIGVANVNGQ